MAKTKNRTWIGVGVATIGGIYLFNRFYLKATDNNNGTVTVKVVEGLKVHKRDYSIEEGVSDLVFSKYKLHVDPQPRYGNVSIELYSIEPSKLIEQRILFVKSLLT